MKHYPDELKVILIQKFLSQPNRSIRSIAKEAGVSKTVLHEWISNYRNSNNVMPRIPSHEWSLPRRLKVITECSQLDEIGVGKYCRSHGIYREHLEQWGRSLMNNEDLLKWQKIQAENKRFRDENKKLEKALKKSERLLAETKALLELKKKASMILEENVGS